MTDSISLSVHFHIRWVASDELDWEPHNTRTAAEETASRLSRHDDEGYTVEQFDDDCTRCASLVRNR